MTISSNTDNKKYPKKDNKVILWFKSMYKENGPMFLIFPFLIVFAIVGGFVEDTLKSDEQLAKVEMIKSNKPMLVCNFSLNCGDDRYTNYNLMKIDKEYKIDVLDNNNTHVRYVMLYRVDIVELIK